MFWVKSGVPVYSCDPRSPWQRGSNENTNGLLRQYLPKGTDLSTRSQAELDQIADSLNRRPRKTLACEPRPRRCRTLTDRREAHRRTRYDQPLDVASPTDSTERALTNRNKNISTAKIPVLR